MTVTRGTTNGNVRGSAEQRRRRKQFLLDRDGDGRAVDCHHCAIELTFETLTVDRIIPGCRGGTYRRDNIRPSCGFCNSSIGGATRSLKTDVSCMVKADSGIPPSRSTRRRQGARGV